MCCTSVKKAYPVMALLGLLVLSGCDDEYPQDLRYTRRAEPLILADKLDTVPTQFENPGQLDSILRPSKLIERDREVIKYPGRAGAEQKQQFAELDAKLGELFGTPRKPTVGGIDDAIRASLRLDDKTLAEGSKLYRLHCLHCHGVTGNGRGPTAPWVNPHPRDYRQGIFKFGSAKGGNDRKPRRADLVRTVRMGIEGTSMPPFGLLADSQIEELVSYVIHLSIRGQVEYHLMREILSDSQDLAESNVGERIDPNLEFIAGTWKAAEENLIKPETAYVLAPDEDRKASARRGFLKFREKSGAGCIGCHADYGRQAALFYDVWGTIGRPADLTTGMFRGGRRPIDLYWRIHSGVNGSNMPAFGGSLNSGEIWDVVNFVQVLPYPKMRKEYGIEIE